MPQRHKQGISLIEVMIVVVIIGVMAAVAAPSLRFMRTDQALRSTARSVADTFMLARSQAIKTGNNVIVVFQGASGTAPPVGLQTTNIMDIIDDGVAASADCTITGAGEVVWSNVPSDDNLSWGTTPTLSGTTPVPFDTGFAPSNSSQGSTFTDATVTSVTLNNNKFASWVVFQPDGIPRLMTPGDCANLGAAGQGGGAIYVTNGRRDYAVVLSRMGTTRVHLWNGTEWNQ